MTTTTIDAVAVVTGAAGGIGQEICRALRAAGARVALVDLDARPLAEVAERLGDGPPLASFALDVTDDAQVTTLPDRVTEHLGPAGILINNAGVRKLGLLLEIDPADLAADPRGRPHRAVPADQGIPARNDRARPRQDRKPRIHGRRGGVP